MIIRKLWAGLSVLVVLTLSGCGFVLENGTGDSQAEKMAAELKSLPEVTDAQIMYRSGGHPPYSGDVVLADLDFEQWEKALQDITQTVQKNTDKRAHFTVVMGGWKTHLSIYVDPFELGNLRPYLRGVVQKVEIKFELSYFEKCNSLTIEADSANLDQLVDAGVFSPPEESCTDYDVKTPWLIMQFRDNTLGDVKQITRVWAEAGQPDDTISKVTVYFMHRRPELQITLSEEVSSTPDDPRVVQAIATLVGAAKGPNNPVKFDIKTSAEGRGKYKFVWLSDASEPVAVNDDEDQLPPERITPLHEIYIQALIKQNV